MRELDKLVIVFIVINLGLTLFLFHCQQLNVQCFKESIEIHKVTASIISELHPEVNLEIGEE